MFNKYDRYKVQHVNGVPVIYTERNRPVTAYKAEQEFKATARETLAKRALRSYHLAAATPDKELREYALERFGWELDSLEAWLRAMRAELEKHHGRQRSEDRIAQLRNVKGRTPEEAAAYLAKADELEARAQ